MADEIPVSRASRPDPLSVLWRVLAVPHTLIILLGLLALALALADLIPQIPSQARSDPQAWLAVQPGPSGWRSLVRVLRFFDVYHAIWFRLLLALIGLVLFVRLADAAELAWQATGRRRWTAASFRFWPAQKSPLRLTAALALEAAPAQLGERLEMHGWRWNEVGGCPAPTVVAGRRLLALWVRPAVYAALLAALAGLAIVSAWGWQGAEWQPYPGQSHAVEENSALLVRLDSFESPEGGVSGPGYADSRITWIEGDRMLRQARVANGRAATLHGLAVRQMGYTPALEIRGWDEAGQQLIIQEEGKEAGISPEVEIVFSSLEARPVLFLPQQDLFLAFSFEASCYAEKPALHVELVRSDGSSQGEVGDLHESGSMEFAGLRVEVVLAYRPILSIDYRPGMAAVWGGLSVALLALGLTWIVPVRLVWLTAGPGEGGTAVIEMVAHSGDEEGRWLAGLASALQGASSSGH